MRVSIQDSKDFSDVNVWHHYISSRVSFAHFEMHLPEFCQLWPRWCCEIPHARVKGHFYKCLPIQYMHFFIINLIS